VVRGGRRSPTPASWLTVVETAPAAFTGTARLTGETPAPVAARGGGYALTAAVEPGRVVFGSPPDTTVELHGETSLPPERRPPPGEPRFPPDALREVPYWDQARPGDPAPVLCVQSQPPVVRALTGPGDDLPDAVAMIRGWTGPADVERDLANPAPAICYVAGFELLLRTTTDVPGLAERVLRLPGRPGAAAAGILQLLQARAAQMPDADVTALARRLLAAMADEQDPQAAVAYLAWFSAQQPRIGDLDGAVRDEAQRVAARPFDGPDGDAWRAEVTRYAQALTG
jgi:hypothetical protein